MALQFLNEICVLFITGVMFGFTEINWREGDAAMAKIVTGLIMAVLIIILMVNLLFIVHSCIFGALHAYRLRQ